MPIKPKSLSNLIRRNDLQSKQDHERRMTDPAQAQAAKVRSSATWQKVRQMVLNRDGVCVECERRGYTSIPTQVDHILPIPEQKLALQCGGRRMTLPYRELADYRGERGQRGVLLPRGWGKVERLDVEA